MCFNLPTQSYTLPNGQGAMPKPKAGSALTTKRKRVAKVKARVDQATKVNTPGKRKKIKQAARWAFYKTFNFCCQYCGGKAGEKDADGDITELAIDHKVSLADGGRDEPDNWICSCKKCNEGKGRKSA